MHNIQIEVTKNVTAYATRSFYVGVGQKTQIAPGTYTLESAYRQGDQIFGFNFKIHQLMPVVIVRHSQDGVKIINEWDDPVLLHKRSERHRQLTLSAKTQDILERFPLRCMPDPMWRAEVCEARKRVAMKRYLWKNGCEMPHETPSHILRTITRRIRKGFNA